MNILTLSRLSDPIY